jgi:hypothetical protein
VYRYTYAPTIISYASELQSQNTILSVDRIRYRYSQPAAVHGIDVANRSGDHIARRSLDDWRQNLGRHGTNIESRSTSCATQKSRTPQEPHAESACGDGARPKGDRIHPLPPCPDVCVTWTPKLFSILYLFSYPWHNSLLTLIYRQGFCMVTRHTHIRLHVIMYKAAPSPHPP